MQHHGFLGGREGSGGGGWSLGGLYISGLFPGGYGVGVGFLALRAWRKWQPRNKRYLVDSSSSLCARGLFIRWHLVQIGVYFSRLYRIHIVCPEPSPLWGHEMPTRVVVFTHHRQRPPPVSLSPMPTPPPVLPEWIEPCARALVLTSRPRIVTSWYTSQHESFFHARGTLRPGYLESYSAQLPFYLFQIKGFRVLGQPGCQRACSLEGSGSRGNGIWHTERTRRACGPPYPR